MHGPIFPPRFSPISGSLWVFCIVGLAQAATERHWIGSCYASPTKYSVSFSNATVRSVVHLTVGGNRLRLRFSNRYGRSALRIGAVRVAANEVRAVTFN